MPRKARQKDPNAIYHVICRGIQEIPLFRGHEDKVHYLKLLKKLLEEYKCKLYAFCLMDTHLHMFLDPRGYNISEFMKSLNTAYVRYYNRKHKRGGPLFRDRFYSSIVDSDRYALAVSAYIHNNSKDMGVYRGREHLYPYSSYGIYLGNMKDSLELIDISFIKAYFKADSIENFRKKYKQLVSKQRDEECIKEIAEKLSMTKEYQYIDGREVILREHKPNEVVAFISERLLKSTRDVIIKGSLALKYSRKTMEFRALCAYAMRVLCGLGYREICGKIYNMTVSGCSKLCSRGFDLVNKNKAYTSLFGELAGLKAV